MRRAKVGVVLNGGRTRLDGLKLIAQYLELSVNQVRKLYGITVPAEDRLPVFTLSVCKGKNGRISVYVDDLDAWLYRRSQKPYENRGR